MKTLNASEGKVRKYTLKGCVFTAYFVLMQSIRNIQHLGEVNLLKVKRQQKRDLCANGLIKSLESSCLNSLRVTFPEKKKKKKSHTAESRTTPTSHKRTECHSLSFKRKQLMRPSSVYCSPHQSLR